MERVYQFVEEATRLLTNEEKENGQGVTTEHVATSLAIQRSNVSKDLNGLVRQGRVGKSSGRPVRYFVRTDGPHRPLTKHVPSYKENNGVKPKSMETLSPTDVFGTMIGANGSMKNAVDQAKAAVLYPPKGLNTLITGPTGSGKSYFAHAMFHYAQSNQMIATEKELLVFNCADYAHNPQLLMSHLFGYSQGAFTGATSSKEGLIQQADEGMLFLDEIHRLPPEGQEMIFYFMDTGMYSRLGESTRSRSATVRIVCATTEDPKSTFLDTFMRRIPIVIQLPSFRDRTVTEQLDLVKLLVSIEATRIQKRITLTEDVVKALIASVGYGNIGQLKSGIQLVCARGFMNQLNRDQIDVTARDLPDSIQSFLLGNSASTRYRSALSKVTEAQLVVDPNVPFYQVEQDAYELPYNLYDIIGDKATLLEEEGLDQDSINQYISTDINVHLKSFYRNHGFSFETESRLAEVVSKEVLQFVHGISPKVEEGLGTTLKQNYIYALSLHISSLLTKIQMGETRSLNERIKEMALNYPKERKVAAFLKDEIAQYFAVPVPDHEVYYLTVLLVSLKEELRQGRVGVVIVTHGNSTATSMAAVAEELLDLSGILAVDMPLDLSPMDTYEKVKQAILRANEGNGVLLLVDMGSLTSFEDKLRLELDIPIRSISMVSTALVLEAARKASLVDADLELLYESLERFNGYSAKVNPPILPASMQKKAIVAICASGEGTAKKLKQIIEKPFANQKEHSIEVLTSSVADLEENKQHWKKEYKIIATTGILDPKMDAPFLPLETFVEMKSAEIVSKIQNLSTMIPSMALEREEETKELIRSYLTDQVLFLNPAKVIEPLWEFSETCATIRASKDTDYSFHFALILHMANLLERIVQKDTLSEPEESKHPALPILENAIHRLERTLNVTIPESEKPYIYYYLTKEEGEYESLDTLLD